MSFDVQRAIGAALLVPPHEWPWEWSPEGDAIVWQDGTTVVMREELTLLVERLLPSGVPRISQLVLLLAACRGKVAEESAVADFFQRGATGEALPLAARAQLTALAAMPRELLTGILPKTSLAAIVFERASKLTDEEASAVLSLLREGLPPGAFTKVAKQHPHRDFLRDLRVLHYGLAPLDAEKITHALRTGIPEAPRAAEVDLPLGESVRALLRELENEREFQGLAQIVRDVMAAIVLPRALPEPDHDSPGGFADIGNRGELHRLLLSELAHDDDTLAARVALGEALYLRREPAANPPPATLALLLDSGLRMWGVPRVFGAAVALACLAKAPAHQGALAFRAAGALAEELALHTRAGLTAHLAALDTSLNPAAALAPLAASLRTAGSRLDVIVVTHPFALEDADFNAACAAQCDAGIHAATVDREGAFALHLRTPGGWQPLASARLKLDALFASPPRRPSQPQQHSHLPAMLRRERCAFLLPVPGKLKERCAAWGMSGSGKNDPFAVIRASIEPSDAIVGVAEDGSLWIWNSVGRRGAIRLNDVRLAGEYCDLIFDSESQCVIAIGHESRGGRLNLIRVFGGMDSVQSHMTQLSTPMEIPIRIWVRGGHLFLGTARQIHVVNIATGSVVADTMMPSDTRWLNGRFVFRSGEPSLSVRDVMTVTFNGTQIVFEPLRLGWLRWNIEKAVRLIPHVADETFWILDKHGRFYEGGAGKMRFDTGLGPLSVVRASDDEQRLLVRDSRGVQKLITFSPKESMPSVSQDVLLTAAAGPHPWTLRSRFTHVAAHPSGRVWLRAQRGYWVAIGLREASHTFALERQPDGAQPPSPAKFGEPEKIAGHGCTLAFAELGDGESAWLDSRGMLHLRAADFFIPEISVVLAESTSLPVWSSNEIIVGPEYFLGDRKPGPGDAEKLDGHLRAFVARCQ